MIINEYKNIKFNIGKDANDNWYMLDIFSKINNKYIWFHLNSFSSPYVIMEFCKDDLEKKYTKDEIIDILNYGSNLCKNNSKYKFLKDIKVIYTSLNKLKKTDKIGEVIISGKKNLLSLH
tara:strand:+ start:1516 stop:1875 length:360 start_codon:yes stop_codon:yes gene_type:complete